MKLTPKAMEIIRKAEARMTPEDAILAKKYPRHTLEQAREIDRATREPMEGYTSGFVKLLAQESSQRHLSGDHT